MWQVRRFEACYREIRRSEPIARGQQADLGAPIAPAALRDDLEDRLLDLKSRTPRTSSRAASRAKG